MLLSKLHPAHPGDGNRLLPRLLIATAIMAAIGVAVFSLNPRKTPEVSLQKMEVFAPHTQMLPPRRAVHILGLAPESEDDVYAVATLAITNKLRLPIFLDSTSATMIADDGTTLEATVIAPSDLPRLEEIFPRILPLVSTPQAPPLALEQAIPPGTTRSGTLTLLFPRTSLKDWQAKKSASLNLLFLHQTEPITVSLR